MSKSQWQVITVLPNGTEISTVELPAHCIHDWSYPFETCVFEKDGPSNVVGHYSSKKEAIDAHIFLVGHELMHNLLSP